MRASARRHQHPPALLLPIRGWAQKLVHSSIPLPSLLQGHLQGHPALGSPPGILHSSDRQGCVGIPLLLIPPSPAGTEPECREPPQHVPRLHAPLCPQQEPALGDLSPQHTLKAMHVSAQGEVCEVPTQSLLHPQPPKPSPGGLIHQGGTSCLLPTQEEWGKAESTPSLQTTPAPTARPRCHTVCPPCPSSALFALKKDTPRRQAGSDWRDRARTCCARSAGWHQSPRQPRYTLITLEVTGLRGGLKQTVSFLLTPSGRNLVPCPAESAELHPEKQGSV